MAKVIVTKEKLDELSLRVASKSGETMPLTIDEMAEAVESIPYPPNLEAKEVNPSESSQTVQPSAGYDGLSQVSVGAVSPNYVGSGITQRSSSDLTASGATVTAPAGYYASSASKSVGSGTEGTPTATKGSVSNHSISVTPSVTNSVGYISGGTKTGTAVTVTASELVSGNKEITENGTNIDVTNYATVSVAVPTGGVTQDSNGYIVLPETGGGGGSTGLVYESGTWTPSEDTSGEWISFTDSHTALPMYIAMEDSDVENTPSDSYGCCCLNNYSAFGGGTGTHLAFSERRYKNTSGTWSSNNASITSSSSLAYYVTTTQFKANGSNNNSYWKAGRTYKWVAVWAPTS